MQVCEGQAIAVEEIPLAPFLVQHESGSARVLPIANRWVSNVSGVGADLVPTARTDADSDEAEVLLSAAAVRQHFQSRARGLATALHGAGQVALMAPVVNPLADLQAAWRHQAMAQYHVVAHQQPHAQLQLQVVVSFEGFRGQDQPGAWRVEPVQEAVGVQDVLCEWPKEHRAQVMGEALRITDIRCVNFPAWRLVHDKAVRQVQLNMGCAHCHESSRNSAIASPFARRSPAIHFTADL
mmetsp:Transcript_110265/g.235487  ORF Transcript_110265/g.235487 Transcript_110265/m.235487 type:complete len:239 (-) Transcript_110265:169-885(-)